MKEIGLSRHPPSQAGIQASETDWNYESFKFKNPPQIHPQADQWCSSIYRGIVPAKNIFARDFAVNGAFVSHLLPLVPLLLLKEAPDVVLDK